MDVNGLIEFHKGDFKSNSFKCDLLDMSLGFSGTEIDALSKSTDCAKEFIKFMNEETFWMD